MEKKIPCPQFMKNNWWNCLNLPREWWRTWQGILQNDRSVLSHSRELHIHSLVLVVAGIGKGLDLHGRLLHHGSGLHGDDGPLNALLQVDEAAVVALCLDLRDVSSLHPERAAGAVGSHGVVDVHADGVVHFRRKSRGRGRIVSCGQLENDTWGK